MADITKLQFYSETVTDKIASYSLTNDSSGIGSGGRMTSIAGPDPTIVTTTMANIPNPYGKRCLMTLSWSLDNINFYPQNQPLFYYNSASAAYFWQALGFGGCSDTKIYFGVDTQYTSNQTIYFQFALDSPT